MEQLMNLSALNMVSEVELVYKNKVKPSERPLVKSAKECYELLKSTWDENKIEFVEQFKVVLMNRAQRVLGIYELSTGGVAGTVADPKLVFTAALKANHPSGNLKPSRADEELTKKIATGGMYLDIKVIDHIIVTSEDYYSFADEGLL
jgi:DNA repair protein RadC